MFTEVLYELNNVWVVKVLQNLHFLKRLEKVLLFAGCFYFAHPCHSTVPFEDFSDEG